MSRTSQLFEVKRQKKWRGKGQRPLAPDIGKIKLLADTFIIDLLSPSRYLCFHDEYPENPKLKT
jgi:hypothetical protein